MAATESSRLFDPRETARAQSLAGLPLAAFWQRAAAFAIDFVIVLAVYLPFQIGREYLALKSFQSALQVELHFNPYELEDLIWLIVYAGLCVWWSDGQTLGKRLMRIRIVSLRGLKITLWQSVERALGYGASTLEGGFGFAQFFLDHNRRCVHDRIAETIVVREQPRKLGASLRQGFGDSPVV
jgi:uncharacterized RDD family membrane protein YckC